MIHQLLVSSNLSPVSYNEFDNGRICYRLPQTKLIAVYVSGGLVRKISFFFFFYLETKNYFILSRTFIKFAIGWWAFIDALIYSKVNRGYLVFTTGEVITGVITTLGMIL
jgi:hypothetical protein